MQHTLSIVGLLHLDMQITPVGMPRCAPICQTCDCRTWVFGERMVVEPPQAAIGDLDTFSFLLSNLKEAVYIEEQRYA